MSDIELVKEWFNYSQNDLISAKHLYNNLHPKQTEIACYHSQQCAEKALKGYLFNFCNEKINTKREEENPENKNKENNKEELASNDT